MHADRCSLMEKCIIEKQRCSIDELCGKFMVSKNTVRRDLDKIEKQGAVKKVSGGAAAVVPSEADSADRRISRNTEAKEYIGMLAARLVEDNDTVFLDSGTTVIHMIPHIAARKNVILITHSVPVLNQAIGCQNVVVTAIGGQYNPITQEFFGPETISAARQVALRWKSLSLAKRR